MPVDLHRRLLSPLLHKVNRKHVFLKTFVFTSCVRINVYKTLLDPELEYFTQNPPNAYFVATVKNENDDEEEVVGGIGIFKMDATDGKESLVSLGKLFVVPRKKKMGKHYLKS